MREQNDGSFNAATANSPWRTELHREGGDLVLFELQCGHGEFAVENPVPPPGGSEVTELQCGHGEFAVENSIPSSRACALKALQCGHGEFAVENIKIQDRRRGEK